MVRLGLPANFLTLALMLPTPPGMTYEGIYRKTGGMGQTKLITQYFERGQDFDLEDRDKFNDIAAITSCLKNYFRSLPNPLMTHELHEEFIAAAGSFGSFEPLEMVRLHSFVTAELPEGDERLRAIERVLYRLPPAHFHTARLLFRHLNRCVRSPPGLNGITDRLAILRIKSLANENKMTSANLGVVFGRTTSRLALFTCFANVWSSRSHRLALTDRRARVERHGSQGQARRDPLRPRRLPVFEALRVLSLPQPHFLRLISLSVPLCQHSSVSHLSFSPFAHLAIPLQDSLSYTPFSVRSLVSLGTLQQTSIRMNLAREPRRPEVLKNFPRLHDCDLLYLRLEKRA